MGKVIRDGKVAVLYSPGFGAGWSTWGEDSHREWALFSPEVVAWVEGGKQGGVAVVEKLVEDVFGNSGFYCGGAQDLEIEWLPAGTLFRVDEYDGSESIHTNDGTQWSIA